ncbi:response regulator [Sagittula salina]|uniref:Response regulator n=1 Tax=Sagittula salina TaxID=2820268 RepID=A0A940MRN4_9RHOB|nr:response regulator [Sagittula salina]MBP0481784.1 response regulator [Sagittula salina]
MLALQRHYEEEAVVREFPPPATARLAQATGSPGSCLVVDDDSFDRRLLRRCLGRDRSDMETFEVENIAAARAFLAERTPDLILLDHRLPDGLGADFARELRADPALSETMVCVITSIDTRLLDPDVPSLSKDSLTPQSLHGMIERFLAERRVADGSEARQLVTEFGGELQDSMSRATARMLLLLRRVKSTSRRKLPRATMNDLEQLEDMLLTFSELSARRN